MEKAAEDALAWMGTVRTLARAWFTGVVKTQTMELEVRILL